jgi:branched-chain amino acid transport system ATP-binding protein
MKKNILLKLHNIHVNYLGVKALDGISMQIDEGEIVALMGPNGAGKSTVLKSIFAIAPIYSGEIFWQGIEVRLKPYEIAELGISFVPQGKRVFQNMSVLENIEIGGHAIKSRGVLKERVEEILNLFPILKEKLNQRAGQLSGGQQQMVAIARGLITDPKLLLLDEPSLGLSPKVVKEVFLKIKEINQKKNTAILVVEHNIKSILEITDRVYIFNRGKLVNDGEGKEILQSDIIRKVFIGKA